MDMHRLNTGKIELTKKDKFTMFKAIIYRKVFPFDFRMRMQRFMRGYSDSDVWNFNDWFFENVPKMLKQLKKGYSYPPDFETYEDWNAVLDEIIVGIDLKRKAHNGELIVETEEQKYYNGTGNRITFFYIGGKVCKSRPCEIGDPCRWDMTKDELGKYKKAMELFSRYLPDMWD